MGSLREWLIRRLEIPARTVLNRKIPKKAFFTQADLSTAEKELFSSQIEGIYLLSVMNQQSMNIPAYHTDEVHYAEVVWIYVQIRSAQNTNRIVSAIHKSIPNPVVLIMESPDGKIILSTVHKRLNKIDITKVVVDQPTITEWFQAKEADEAYIRLLDSLIISKLSYDNLYNSYDDVHQWLKCEEAISLVGMFPNRAENREGVFDTLAKLQENKNEIQQLKQEQNGQLNFGVKMDLYMKIKRKEQQADSVIQQLKSKCNQ